MVVVVVVTVFLLPCVEAQASVILLSFCFNWSSSGLCLCFVPLWLLSFWSILLLFLCFGCSLFFVQSPTISLSLFLCFCSIFFFSFFLLSQSILPSISHPPSLSSMPLSIIGRGRETHPVLSSHGTW